MKAFILFTTACYVKGSNTNFNFKSKIDKDTGLTVIPVVIVSNQKVQKRNIAFSFSKSPILSKDAGQQTAFLLKMSLPQVFVTHFASKNQLLGFSISGTLA